MAGSAFRVHSVEVDAKGFGQLQHSLAKCGNWKPGVTASRLPDKPRNPWLPLEQLLGNVGTPSPRAASLLGSQDTATRKNRGASLGHWILPLYMTDLVFIKW